MDHQSIPIKHMLIRLSSKNLTRQIILPSRLAQEREESNVRLSDTAVSSNRKDSQAETVTSSNNQLEPDTAGPAEALNGNENLQSLSTSSNDDDDDQPASILWSDSSERIFPRAHVVKLAQTAIPHIKVTRTFFRKLSKPSSKLPFTIDTRISSHEVQSIKYDFKLLAGSIELLGSILGSICENDELGGWMGDLGSSREFST
ncbi:hypothetical protein PtB15_8B661 [Puccinia triticina]|nr:hypothetical protein PtB15_8B661 [Puccinia triticina]